MVMSAMMGKAKQGDQRQYAYGSVWTCPVSVDT